MTALQALDFEIPCGHASCRYPADFGVWVSHGSHACRPDTGFRCAVHADELEQHWTNGLGGVMQCGCTVDGALEDHFRLVAL